MQSDFSKVLHSLSPKERILFNALTRRTEQGFSRVETIFKLVRPEWCNNGKACVPRRRQQMYLGPIISRINRKLGSVNRAVVPGPVNGTYRYIRTK